MLSWVVWIVKLHGSSKDNSARSSPLATNHSPVQCENDTIANILIMSFPWPLSAISFIAALLQKR